MTKYNLTVNWIIKYEKVQVLSIRVAKGCVWETWTHDLGIFKILSTTQIWCTSAERLSHRKDWLELQFTNIQYNLQSVIDANNHYFMLDFAVDWKNTFSQPYCMRAAEGITTCYLTNCWVISYNILVWITIISVQE